VTKPTAEACDPPVAVRERAAPPLADEHDPLPRVTRDLAGSARLPTRSAADPGPLRLAAVAPSATRP
jgi:hypothetical protein